MSRPLGSALRAVRTAMLALAVAGCGVAREESPTSPAGTLPISGRAHRAGEAASGVKVKLYDDASSRLVDSTLTAADGSYGFAGVPAGRWMVKISGPRASDLGYVRWFFSTGDVDQVVAVPPFDLADHGLAPLTPAEGDTLAVPSFASPIVFRWSAYGAPAEWSAVYLDDAAGELAWQSMQAPSTEASFAGTGNQGGYAGDPIGRGRWTWRVKVRLAYGVQGATRDRLLVLE